jgi:hypothetical protein
MSKKHHDKGFEDMRRLFDNYFILLKETREMANKIPDLESIEEKIKAYKEYFRKIKALKESQVNVEDSLGVLSALGE